MTRGRPGDRRARRIVRVCRRLYERGLIAGPDGNVSVRLSGDGILVTPAGLSKVDVTPDDLVVVSLRGEVIAGLAPAVERVEDAFADLSNGAPTRAPSSMLIRPRPPDLVWRARDLWHRSFRKLSCRWERSRLCRMSRRERKPSPIVSSHCSIDTTRFYWRTTEQRRWDLRSRSRTKEWKVWSTRPGSLSPRACLGECMN